MKIFSLPDEGFCVLYSDGVAGPLDVRRDMVPGKYIITHDKKIAGPFESNEAADRYYRERESR